MRNKQEDMIILFAVALVLIGCIIFFIHVDYNAPLKKAERSAKEYLAQYHPDSDYEISSIDYDDKYKIYTVTISSPGSVDDWFNLIFDTEGNLEENLYEYQVINKVNTANRLSDEYAAAVSEALDTVPGCTEFVQRGQLLWTHLDGPHPDPRYLASEELQLNGTYDLSELGAQAGHIWFRMEVDHENLATVENLAQVLLYVRKTLDEADIPFYQVDCQLNYWKGKNSKELLLNDFEYEDIYEEDLETRLEKAMNG